MGLTKDLFTVMQQGISGKDLILILGALFLVAKSTHEIHSKVDGDDDHASAKPAKAISFTAVMIQVVPVDLVFFLDSAITAVGMVNTGSIGGAAHDAAPPWQPRCHRRFERSSPTC